MGLPPWETSDSQLFALITGANSGLGFGIASRIIEEFISSPSTPRNKHLILILCTRSPLKTRFTISRLRAHTRNVVEESAYAKAAKVQAAARGSEYKWENEVQRIHFLGVEVDLCDLKSIYSLADRLVNGTVGSPDATTAEGRKLPHGSPGTSAFSSDLKQDTWALSQEPGSTGVARSWGWGLSGIRVPRIDVIILPAGFGGWNGVNWPIAIRQILMRPFEAITWPEYKVSKVGLVVKRQPGDGSTNSADGETQHLLSEQEDPREPPLGEVFCSNVFGHYLLTHELMPLLSVPATSSSRTGGRIIWISSIEAVHSCLDMNDIQGLKSNDSYGSSKRLMDILSLTSELPSVKRISAPYFDPKSSTSYKTASNANSTATPSNSDSGETKQQLVPVKPTMHLTHPGIFVSEIFEINLVLTAIYTGIFYLLRWLGSPWHPITAYKAAVPASWLALISDDELSRLEGDGLAKQKWGASTNSSGEERVKKTEVPGWGWGGKVVLKDEDEGGKKERLTGRKHDAVDLTKEAREEFEVLGAKCWTEMEELRQEWEGILGVGKAAVRK